MAFFQNLFAALKEHLNDRFDSQELFHIREERKTYLS